MESICHGDTAGPLPGLATGVPNLDVLQTGELVKHLSSKYPSRMGRLGVKIRVVGNCSLGWSEAAASWGGTVEALVLRGNSKLISDCLDHLPEPCNRDHAVGLPPVGVPWDGILCSTIGSDSEACDVIELFRVWRPLIAIISLSSRLSRPQVGRLKNLLHGELQSVENSYHELGCHVSHHKMGGVTRTCCHVMYLSRQEGSPPSARDIMTTAEYQRPLQTALDDTIGRHGPHIKLFDLFSTPRDSVVGEVTVTSRGQSWKAPVYSSAGFAPDVSRVLPKERELFVQAESVYAPGDSLVRAVKRHEVLSIWDYEGKLESSRWSSIALSAVVEWRLRSPPGKIIRGLLFPACDSLLPHVNPLHGPDHLALLGPGLSKDIPFNRMEGNVSTRVKAAQADNAEADLSNWASDDETPRVASARQVLRRFAVIWWYHHQVEVAHLFLQTESVSPADFEAVEDILGRLKHCTYFTWPRGSRILYYKFKDPVWRKNFRDGIPFCRTGTLPMGKMKNAAVTREAELVAREKILKLRVNGYTEGGKPVLLATPRFPVPKAVDDNGIVTDVRIVWDSKINRLNRHLWAAGFRLPTCRDGESQVVKWLLTPVSEYLREGSPVLDYTQEDNVFIKSKQGDIDVGQHFNNFRMHEVDRPYNGVRQILTNNAPGGTETQTWRRFTVLPFGTKCSPYYACQGESRILEHCKGDPADPKEPFQFDRVLLNCPFSPGHDPAFPEVMLIRKDGELATQEKTFVDDIHVAGRSKEGTFDHALDGCRRLKSRMNSVGNQADDRKYRPPCLTPGAWRGVIIHTDTPFPMKSTTSKKWVRFKDGLKWILELGKSSTNVETSELRRIAGLGVHLTEVYEYGRSYLKGFFNALEAWRYGRDVDGWRLQMAFDTAADLEIDETGQGLSCGDYPPLTPITGEMIVHATALLELFESETPLMVPIRPTDKHKLRYAVGDASAEGFAMGMLMPDGRFDLADGLWDAEFAKGGSNLREAQNQVNFLLKGIREGKHDGCSIWAATDNAVFSGVWHKGMSSARHLFDLVLCLKKECHKHEVFLHVFHISGERMIACGIDGASRGNEDTGVLAGFDLRTYFPIDKSAFELANRELTEWCKYWMGDDFGHPLKPIDWYIKGHTPGVHVWSPPPGAALMCLNQLSLARHKRPHGSTHVFFCPRLLWDEDWRKRFEKEMDLWFMLHVGTHWPHTNFEPLLVGISFPMRHSHKPFDGCWLVRQRREEVVEVGRALQQMSKTCHLSVGNYLRELWRDPWVFPDLPERVVR